MNTYLIVIRDENYLSSIIDTLYIRAPSPEGAIKKARQHGKKQEWTPFLISRVEYVDGTVVP